MADPFEDEVLAFFAVDGPVDTREEAVLRARVRRLEAELAYLRAAARAACEEWHDRWVGSGDCSETGAHEALEGLLPKPPNPHALK